MSNIEKGLDEIIGSKSISSGGRKPNRGFKKSRSGANTKTLGKAIAATRNASRTSDSRKELGKGKHAAGAGKVLAANVNPLTSAKRAVVSNMPLDVNEQAIRKYFSDNVGKIKKVEGTFRANGTPTGTFTLTFEKPGMAQLLAEKFHNQPVDGGKSFMSVQILLDAVKAQPPSLQGRIGNASTALTADSGNKKKSRRAKKTSDTPVKAVQTPVKETKTGPKKNVKKISKPKRRSAADLDAEMSDYFSKAEQNEISV